MTQEQMDQVTAYDEDHLDEYKAFLDHKRQVGLTIDPATAETTFWYADDADPYYVLDHSLYEGQVGRARFARAPGGEWVDFNDLPDATGKALAKRDRAKLWITI